jgi:hypothetical protein
LGRIGASEWLPNIERLLREVNASPFEDRAAGEHLARAAIQAIASLNDEEAYGYIPVFFAANGWYSLWVRQSAWNVWNDAFPGSADRIELMLEIINNAVYSHADRLLVLRYVNSEEAGFDDAEKARAAAAAFREGWRSSTRNPNLPHEKTLLEMRKLALNMIREHGAGDENMYALLDRSYRLGLDEEERFSAIRVLASEHFGTDTAVRLLSSYVFTINDRLNRGWLNREDERFIRRLIPAIGDTGNPEGIPALRHVLTIGWSAGIRNLAEDALGGL